MQREEICLICPKCWKINCEQHKKSLVQIDASISDIIIRLNLKGYKTKYCCGGHVSNIHNEFLEPTIYIMFHDDIVIHDIPAGFEYIQHYNQIQATCDCDNVMDQIEWLNHNREILRNWSYKI